MIIGLTGGISSGKSTVSNLFKKYGFPIVDADVIAREVVEPEKEAWRKIIHFFGRDILGADHTIDRKKLGQIIFSNKEKRRLLNEITHPIIIKEIMQQATLLQKKYDHVIVDIPLLFESKREELFDLIILVYVNKETQLKRLMNRDLLNQEEALQKIDSQMELDKKKELADVVVYNDQTIEETEKQVYQIIQNELRKLD